MENPVTILLEDDDYSYYLESKFSEDSLVNSYSIKPSLEKGEEIKEELNSDEFTNLEESFQKEILKRYSSIFNVTYRSNSRVETLRENILAEIDDGRPFTRGRADLS